MRMTFLTLLSFILQAFTCPKCSKTLLTPRGFKGHVDKCDKTPSVSVSSEQQPSTSSSTNVRIMKGFTSENKYWIHDHYITEVIDCSVFVAF